MSEHNRQIDARPKAQAWTQYLCQTRQNSLTQALEPKVCLRLIRRLDTDSLEVFEEVSAVVREVEPGEFVASFEKAGMFASGESREMAMRNLSDELQEQFTYFTANESRLGSEPKRQLEALRQHIRVKKDGDNHE